MIYLSLNDVSEISDELISLIGEKIKIHFTDKANLKKKESVYVKAVLCHVLKEKFNLTDFLIDCDENEKPYILNSDLYFNLSHSGMYVLCACGDEQVGCDVQSIKNYNEKIAKRFYTANEYEVLRNSENKDADFTRLWTMKESILKYHGVGISGGLSSYDFSEYFQNDKFSAFGLLFETRQIQNYIVSVCSKSGKNLWIDEIKAEL